MIMSKSRIAKTAAPEIFTKCTFEVKLDRVHNYSFASFDHAIYNVSLLLGAIVLIGMKYEL